MALSIPIYPNPFDAASPFVAAYAYIAGIGLDASSGTGRLVLHVHPSESAWTSAPVDRVVLTLGEPLIAGDPSADPPVEPVTFPSLAELMADEQFAAAYATIGAILYAAAQAHPKLTGSTAV